MYYLRGYYGKVFFFRIVFVVFFFCFRFRERKIFNFLFYYFRRGVGEEEIVGRIFVFFCFYEGKRCFSSNKVEFIEDFLLVFKVF